MKDKFVLTWHSAAVRLPNTSFGYFTPVHRPKIWKLDHRRLEVEMKGSRFLFSRAKQIVCSRSRELGGNGSHSLYMCVRVPAGVWGGVVITCEVTLYSVTDFACEAEGRRGRLSAFAAACPEAVERPPLIARTSTTAYCLPE